MRPLLAALVVVAALTGCASTPPTDDGLVHVVASTNVYGDIAEAIGGDLVDVTSIIDDPSQDPHSFEGDVRVQLALSKAHVVIENGGGYDDFVDTLLAGANNAGVALVTVADLGGADADVNEHLWYDLPTMRALAAELAARFSQESPENAATFEANSTTFSDSLAELEQRQAALASRHSGAPVAITEPVPNYLLIASGLAIATPTEFSEAIEEGTDVSPLILKQALEVVRTAALLAYNEQTTDPQTELVLAAAKEAGVPIVAVTETLPAGVDYVGWMSANLDAIEMALP